MSKRIFCWKIFLEESDPMFHHIPGPNDVVANSLSQTPALAMFLPCIGAANVDCDNTNDTFLFSDMESPMTLPLCNAQTDSHSVEDSCLFHLKFNPQGRHPFNFKTTFQCQQKNLHVLKLPSLHL